MLWKSYLVLVFFFVVYAPKFSTFFFFENHLDRTFLSHVHRTKMIFSYATQCKLHKERNNLCLKSTKKINSKTWLIISFRKQYIWCKVICNVKIVINSTIAGLFTYEFHKFKIQNDITANKLLISTFRLNDLFFSKHTKISKNFFVLQKCI